MALLTPLNVNCHASDGRKVRAVTSSSLELSAPQENHYASTKLELKELFFLDASVVCVRA